MTISSLAITILGWLGAAASIAAYYLVSSKRFAPDSLRYHSLNVSSCILLALACASTGAWPSFLTNAIFIGVGCTMIWRVRSRLARRVMQVIRFFDVRRYLPRRSLYPPPDQLRTMDLLGQDFFKPNQGKVCKKNFIERLENIDGESGR